VNTWIIARFTLQEAASRRLILAGLLLSAAFLALFGLGFGFLYGRAAEQTDRTGLLLIGAATLLTTLGLYAVYFLTSFLALLLSVGAVSSEVESGALLAVLARPIRRPEYLLGRWLGQALLVGLYVVLMSVALLFIARLVADYQAPDAPRAVALLTLSALLLQTLGLVGSTLLPTLANGVVVFSLFGLAWLAGMIEFIGGLAQNLAMVNLGIAVSLLLPSDALWRGASYYLQSETFLSAAAGRPMLPFASSSPPTTALLVWSTLQVLALLLTATAAFARRDL
jgi:ABC-type transport system involved in multi-copper enzyme maturation permease subunit